MKTADILQGLETIANQYVWIATLWHILFYSLIIALIAKWEPSNKLLGILLCIPLLSVALLAFINGNPFNGTIFSIITLLMLFFITRGSGGPIETSKTIFLIIGIAMVAYGLIYPHFLETNTFFKYLYAAPTGLVPCPTLSVLIGFVLIYNGFGASAVNLVFIIAGLFYGLFGAFKLGVTLDAGLIIGSVTLLVKYLTTLKA
jgi:hypothetical protein